MTAKRYASEAALMSAMFGTVNKTDASVEVEPRKKKGKPKQQEKWVEDRVRRAATAEQIETYAEILATIFEDPELSPNLVTQQPAEDPLAPTDWRKAAKRAGKLLGRDVTVFKSRGRQTAVLIPNDEERAAEEQRLGEVMDAVHRGVDPPPPLPRRYR